MRVLVLVAALALALQPRAAAAEEPSDRRIVMVGLALAVPTFFLGTVTKEGKLKVVRRLVGAHPIANFRTAIDAALGQLK